MKIESITLLEDSLGMDQLILHTDLPAASWPFKDKETAVIKVAHGTGKLYCKVHFPEIPLKEIKC